MADRRAALILTGGSSRRMGQPKEWLKLQGETLAFRAARVASQACTVVAMVAAGGQVLPPLPAGVLRIDDLPPYAGQGPLAGALAGLTALQAVDVDTVYIGSVDAAQLSVAHIDHVLSRLEAEPNRAAAVPYELGPNGGHILHATSGAVRLTSALPVAAELLRTGVRALRQLYEALDAKTISASSLPDPRAIASCNTPEEFARLSRGAGTPS